MSEVIVDASVAIKWFVPEIHSEAAAAWIAPDIQLASPDFITLEVASALWKKVRRGEIEESVATAILAALETAPLELLPSAPLVADALELAIALDRSVYDCVYLAVAVMRNCQLVTADRKFHAAVSATALAKRIRWVEDV